MIPYNASLNTSTHDWSGNDGLFIYFDIGVVYIYAIKKLKRI